MQFAKIINESSYYFIRFIKLNLLFVYLHFKDSVDTLLFVIKFMRCLLNRFHVIFCN
jgi:hypothetical protein